MSVSAAKRYTCWGSVRGGCDVAHKSERTAESCIARDHRECQSAGGYSDRRVRVIAAMRDATRYGKYCGRGPGKPLESEDSP